MSQQSEQLKQLLEDYRAGKITGEEFSIKKSALNTPSKPVNKIEKTPMPTNTKLIIGIGSALFIALCAIAFLIFWHSPEQTGKRVAQEIAEQMLHEEKIQKQADVFIGDIELVIVGVLLITSGNTGYGTTLAKLPGINDIINELKESDESLKKKGETGWGRTIRYPERFSFTVDYDKRNQAVIKYDISGVPDEVKKKIIMGDKLRNKDGSLFVGKSDAIYIWTNIKVEK